MVVVIMADMATTSASVRICSVPAQVVNLPTSHIKHHLHQVLADVMDIPLNTADHHLPDRPSFRRGDMGPQDIQTPIERVSTHEHLRHKVFIPLIEVTHHLHTGGQTIHDHLKG
jgi:hypothetical protein